MDEPPSPLLKSRVPRKTVIVNRNLYKYHWESGIADPHCPLRKGIICYRRNDTIFEHNIHSSELKHEPRIIVPKQPSRELKKISFVPIKGNRILLFAKYSVKFLPKYYLHLSIHKVRSDHRVGPVLWSFNGGVDGHVDIRGLELIKSTDNELGITFWEQFGDHWKLFDISTTTDDVYRFPLIESGRIGFDLKFKPEWVRGSDSVTLSPDTRILLNVDVKVGQHNETIDIHYLNSGGTHFSFVTHMSIPVAEKPLYDRPELAFSADGSKFAMAMAHGGVSVWDIRSKAPLRTFTGLPQPNTIRRVLRYPQFCSGNLGKEILVFAEHDRVSDFAIIHVVDATSFEMEERLFLKNESRDVVVLFFDPREGTLYAELHGTIYQWDLQKNGPEWWIGEE